MKTYLFSVTADKFCAGLIFNQSGIVIKSAPILGWTIGKKAKELKEYFDKKNWKFEYVNGEEINPSESCSE